jgi:hypothetical protein
MCHQFIADWREAFYMRAELLRSTVWPTIDASFFARPSAVVAQARGAGYVALA